MGTWLADDSLDMFVSSSESITMGSKLHKSLGKKPLNQGLKSNISTLISYLVISYKKTYLAQVVFLAGI